MTPTGLIHPVLLHCGIPKLRGTPPSRL